MGKPPTKVGFREYAIYQIYPKSFRDTTGSGIGDLRGVIEKIPYIASLGIDMIWFNPFFVSPQRDGGYDVADYYNIDPAIGTMDDFDELVRALADNGIGVMLDMVLNHTSTEHEWFQKALAGDKKYQDFYIIRPPAADGGLPTNWESKFGGPAWAPFGDTGNYYLHLYDPTQADLNWRNPEVRDEMVKIVNFWRAKGIHGFRFDVINVIGKAAELKSSAPGEDPRYMYTDGPDVNAYLQQLNAESFGQDPDSVTVGEMSSTSIQNCVEYSNPDNHELDMVFSFHHLKVDYLNGQKWSNVRFNPIDLKRTLNEWALGMQEGNGWNALFLNNHDQPRSVNRFGDPTTYRVESATMLATMIHMLRGTPYIYMGEEIGMTDPEYHSIDDYVDVEARNAYNALIDQGVDAAEAFAIVHSKARDNSRTPMQWDDSPNAGFTTGTPWLRPTNQEHINVAAEEQGGKILAYYKKLIRLRKQHLAISIGEYRPYQLEHPQVYAFTRTHEDEKLLVIINLSDKEIACDIPEDFATGEVLIANYPNPTVADTIQLHPYEALTLKKEVVA
ncbi:alpha,alpha-phosphotrehalase [Corynebacterium matruchotii]|uniref:alpha,alpha-phosphotrehalase n=1 Tax=Corynebacterium matruchotii TaxID=43768 RepID=UPI003C7703BB